MEELEFILQEYVLTANDPKYGGDYSIINSKFPELADIDPFVLEEYVLTANDPKNNGDYSIINSKFSEDIFKEGVESGLPEIEPSTFTRTTPQVVAPEIVGEEFPLSSEDFYSILKEDDEEEEEKEEVIEEEVTPQLPTAVADVSAVYQQPVTGAFEEETVIKNEELAAKDQELLEAWLNEEYFGKGVANQAMGTDNITAYQINDPSLGDLKQDFKSNLGEIGISRTAFPNLSDSDLDEIFGDVFSTQARAAERKEGEKDERIKVNEIISKKEKDQTDAEAIEISVDRLDNAKINSYENKLEAEFAQNVKKLKGELTEEERERIENYLDPEIPGSLGDRLFNKDETIQVKTFDGFETRRTGKRIAKDEKYEIYHDPVSGRNIKKTEARAVNNNGGTAVNITDAYETYLTSFKNTSQDDLAKYNSRLLLEEAGYNMENEEVGNYYVGDKTMRNILSQRGYESDKQGVFKDVPLGVLTQLSHVPGKWDFWSPDSYMSKGEIIPQDFENKPYENEEEFIEFLQTRRKQSHDIAAKNAALKQVYYLNRDPSTISKNRIGQFGGAFTQSMFGENIAAEQFQPTNQKIVDVIGSQVIPESGADITEQQAEIFERTFADEATEAAGGLTSMLLVLSPINKVQKALGINKMIAGLSAPRYVNKAGKSIKQSKAIKEASKVGKNLDDWAKGTGYTEVAASSLQKGIGLATLGVYEDFKMREVLGAVTDGRMEFERGVGFGFAIAPKVLPYGFGRFGRGKKYDLTHSRNQLNTFMQSTFVNAPSFALAVEGGDALGALVRDVEGKEEYETWAKHHWSDRNTNMRRIGLNLITGKALGLIHFNAMDFKTTENIGKFQRQSVEFIANDLQRIQKLADANNMTSEQFIKENPNHKEVQNHQKHWEDFNMATQRLDLINNSAEWTDPAKAKKTYENHYKPLTELFKSKGKEVKIEVTDKPIYQEIVKNGKLVKQEVSALYTRLGEGKNKNIATIQINTKKAKGKQYANHEGLHAYLDLMFDGNIKMKEQFTNSFKEALKSIKTPGSNLYQDILNTKDIKEIDKLEEMMAYSAEYLGKAEYYNALVGNQAFTKVKKFWNNFAESTLGHKADLTLKQDIIDLLGTYGKTGDIKKLEGLNEIIEYDPTGKAREGQVATTDINKTVEQIKSRKEDVLQEIKDLRTAKPKGYEKIIEEKTAIFNELNTNQRKLENKVELDAVDVSKKGEWKNQIDRNYTVGKHKNQTEFQKSPEFGKVSNDILTSKGLDNMIRQAATKVGVAEGKKNQFVSDVKDRVLERFIKNYDPSVVNKEYGRALTPFEYLTTGQKRGTSIIYRSAGDIMNKYKEQVPTISYDAFEGGADIWSEETGYMKTDNVTSSKVEQEGIVVAKSLGITDVVVKKAAGDTKNLDFETTKAKDKVSYKNLIKNYKNTIEKDIVVDHYGVSPETYKKMKKRDDQQLNNPDIEAIQNKIKENIETHIKLLPQGLQKMIDPITGENVALKTVAGVPSEAKATGTTRSLLTNPLLYKKIPQPGKKGPKYEWSDRLKEYHKTLDPVVKKKFEQNVLDSWGMGETKLSKAQLSGIYKGIMTQTGKAVYMQSVKQALPNTSSLTAKHALANMVNQISAGKSTALASTNINKLIELIRKDKILLSDIRKNLAGIPGSKEAIKVLEEIIMERDALTKDVDVIKANEKYQSELEGKTEAELDVAYAESVSRSKEIAKKNGLSEKHADPNYIAKNPGEKIKGVELVEWRKKLDAEVVRELGIDLKDLEALTTKKGQSNHHALETLLTELGFGSKSRKQTLSDGSTVYLNKEGRTSAEAIEAFLGEKFTTAEGKSASKYKNVYRPDWSGLKKKLDKLEKEMEGESIENIKDAKIELYRKEASHSGKSKDFEATEKANRKFFEDYITAVAKVAYKNKNNNGVEYLLQSRAMQTNHAKGISKSLGYKMTSLNAIGSKPGEIKTKSAKGEVKIKDNKGISNHWEHALQLLNQTNRIVDLIRKHKSVTPKFKKGLKEILDISDQHLIPKNGQLFNDAKGPTTFTKAYTEMLKKGIDNPLLNVFANQYARLENNFIVGGPNKGKSLLDVQLESLDLKIAKKALAKIPESQWGLFEYQLSNKIKSGKKIETQNKKVLSEVIRTKDLASKDINKAIKTIDKALENSRKKDKTSRGMSTWDFDDTLAYTKSGVRYTLPNPSGKPAPGKKVVFMAGGAGSGKSNVIKKLGLQKQGFKIVNQDISLEWLMKNSGLPTDMREFTKEERSKFGKLTWEAKQIALGKKIKFRGKGDGVIVDGTGASLKVMEKQVQEFKDAGYDVQMIFTETSKDVAIARNKARPERSLKTFIVVDTWNKVQGNKEAFKKLFGERFAEVNTDNLKMEDAMPPELTGKLDAFTKGYIKARLNAGEFADKGAKLKEQGAEFDFEEFNVIKEGEPGPFFQKALDRAKKYGTKDQFILTARPPEAAPHIQEFLKSLGLDIPLENITGLGNSTGEAKAMWMLEKFAEGYNDMYFADDAMQNVKAVKNILDQLDIKSKVQQALASKDINLEINNIMEHSLDIEAKKIFSTAEGKVRGKDKKRRKFFIPDSAADLELLMEPLYGKGKKGKENKKWFEEEFYKPWERGVNDLNTARQTILNDYMSLRKANKDIVKSLDKPVEGTNFTVDQAARVYIWNKAGFEVPGLTKTSKAKLLEHVTNNPKLQAYAETVAKLTKIETGLKQPKNTWWAETIASEVSETGRTVNRDKYIGDWIEKKKAIFTEENMAKMESELGPKWRESVEDIFYRMETGATRKRDLGRIGNNIMNYLNGSVGAIMNLNTRSATLQLISSVNFINHAENNPLAATKAFANQPQYWKDFMRIMNSDMLKQRRDGLKINVTEAELAAAVHGKGSKAKRALAWILKQGYIPTKIADSFAIASGGATYYRNRIKMYEKQGLTTKEAEKKAWMDFQAIAEKTQQSSRPDLLSQQQVSFEGRLILPFANTPMQMNRIMMKELLDVSKGRYDGWFGENSYTNKMSKVAYYGAVQSMIFAGLQTGLFALMANDADDDIIATKKVRAYNTMADSFLRGMGITGATVAAVKNATFKFLEQNEKGFTADYSEVGEALLNISPTIGSKFSKLDQAGNTYSYNKKEILEKGLSLDNTKALEASATVVEAITNVPIARVIRKTQNIQDALDEENEAWQRLMMILGWSAWDVGVAQEEKKKEKEKKKRSKRGRGRKTRSLIR